MSMSDAGPVNVSYEKVKKLNLEEMQAWAEKGFHLQGDRDAETAWAKKALRLFVKTGLASYKSDLEEAGAKALFLALVAFYCEFWGTVFQSTEYVSYYDWAEYFKKASPWLRHLARQRGLRTGESEDGNQEDVFVEDLESLANDLRGQMLVGFRDLLGDSSEIFLFFYSACGESDRDEILGCFDPNRQAAYEFVDAEVGALPRPVNVKKAVKNEHDRQD